MKDLFSMTNVVDFQHQRDVFERAKDRDYYALFLEQGLGKSRVAIELVEHHHANVKIGAGLILCPKSIVGNWQEELTKHSSSPFVSYTWPAGKDIPEFRPSPILGWLILNHDALTRDNFVELFKAFQNAYGLFALVADESTAYKSPTAQRTKIAMRLTKYAAKRYILSGTPITQSPLDAWSQFEILKPGSLGSESYYSFQHRYAVKKELIFGQRRFQKIVGFRNLEELTKNIKKHGSILSKEECLDLPDKIYRTINVPLTVEQKRLYDTLKSEALAYFNEEKIIAVNAISLLIKLLQVAAGQIKRADGTYEVISSDRPSVVADLVNECAGKTIVWSNFVGQSANLKKVIDAKLKDEEAYSVLLTADMSSNARTIVIHQWKTDPKCRALIANPGLAGYGLTLTESSNVIYASLSASLEHYLQSSDRTHRIGQTKSVLYTHTIAKGTVEERIMKILKDKKNISDLVMDRKARMELLV
jgi:SNF2 family DNA or RNA helicase